MQIEQVTLSSDKVILAPLNSGYVQGLSQAVSNGKLWELTVTKVPFVEEVPEFINAAVAAYAAGTDLAFAIIDKETQQVVGSTRYMKAALNDKRAEVGYTFLAKSYQRSYVNTHIKFLMLSHAFETLDLNRVEFLTDSTNTASMNALSRIGAVKEGVLRQHMVMRDGRLRHSVVYSIINSQWPEVKQQLLAKMNNY
jgi:RimJ/RimL family protein N-acetyltransferase